MTESLIRVDEVIESLIRVLECQREHRAQFLDFLQDFAALLMPTTPVAVVTLDQVDETVPTVSLLTRPVNYLELSALAVPGGFDAAGLPLSLQIIGRPEEEALVLRKGHAYKQNAPQRRGSKLEAFVSARAVDCRRRGIVVETQLSV